MEIPLWIILVPLGIIMFSTFLFLFFNVFHLARYGIVGRGAVPLIALYIGSYFVVLGVGAILLMQIDWSYTTTLSTIFPTFPAPSMFGL